MHELKSITLNELQTNEKTKTLLKGLLDANFKIYFCLITKDYTQKKKTLSSWFYYEKEGIFACCGRSASWDWLMETSTIHKPNTKTGAGRQILEKSEITLEDLFFTYQESEKKINKGQEQKFDKISDSLKFWDVLQVLKG